MTFDDEITAALRRDLQAAHVGFDAARAEDMIRVATQSAPLGERRAYAAPLAAAAAVVVIGGGVATFAATRDSGTATGGGPVPPVPCPPTSTSAAPSESASAIPPVYPLPAAPPSTLYPTPVTSTASDLPLHLPSSTPVPSASGSATAAPPNGGIAMTLPPVSTTPAVPGSTVEPTVVLKPLPSTSPTDDPCTRTDAPTSSDMPSPVPTTPCEPGALDPGFCGSSVPAYSSSLTIGLTVRANAHSTGTATMPLASGDTFVVTELRFHNSDDTGRIRFVQGSTVVLDQALAGLGDHTFTLDAARQFPVSAGKPLTIGIDCANTSTACAPTVEITGHYEAPSTTTSSTPTPTHP
ncbi:MAG TPA: hypothetical protein VGN18_09340 [Jatrophihabitans sp.]|jgi:hypothetical protein|uniref:hypothetical protein n=1 Tax=Jatrophihabitans sp. TaxID=1932789 RepID=UPI002E065A5F|nr:hypothetical protein [Jatrophihabitans sp.]